MFPLEVFACDLAAVKSNDGDSPKLDTPITLDWKQGSWGAFAAVDGKGRAFASVAIGEEAFSQLILT